MTGNNFAGTHKTLAPGFSADFETTRIYLSGSAHLYRAPGLTHDYASVRAGFSLYEVDYDETQPPLVLEARRRDASISCIYFEYLAGQTKSYTQ